MSRRTDAQLQELRRQLEPYDLPPRIRGVLSALLDAHGIIAKGVHVASCNDLRAQGYMGAVAGSREAIRTALEEITRAG